tara:strand:- start:891 stop:1907 length:1017 start_codon:yes stop_codon:yes gene_type:complete
MSHQISIQNGIAEAAYAIKPAWHGLGAVLTDAMSAEEAYEMAHLNWQVQLQNIQYEGPDGSLMTHPNQRLTVRMDNGTPLGTVSGKYQIVQNRDQFQFFDGLFSDEEIKFESAFAMKGGEVVCLLARIPGHVLTVGDGDTSEPYLMSINSHNGMLTQRIYPTGVRAVCWNTVQLAMQQASTYVGIRHFGNVAEATEAARGAIRTTLNYWDSYCEAAKRLADFVVDHDDAIQYIESVFPATDEKNPSTHVKNVRSRVFSMWMEQRQRMRGIENTAWSLLNAVTEYVDHEARSKGGDDSERQMSRVYNAYIGQGSTKKAKAISLASEMFIEPNEKTIVTV